MRVVCTVIAALWTAVVVSRATESPPGRCCPSRFEVDPNPSDYQFRCDVANWTDSCDDVNMTEHLANTAINTQSNDYGCNNINNTYLLYDWNWEDLGIPFQQNIACAYYLPPVVGCSWVLFLEKRLDPIECGDNCNCECEDHVCIEEVDDADDSDPNKKTYCDFTDPPEDDVVGWCGSTSGPHNVHGTLPSPNRGVRTTFRSDNIDGTGEGAFVFAIPVPSAKKRSIRQQKLPLPVMKRTAYCRTEYFCCKNRTCKIPCECYYNIQQRITCFLYEIFTDATGRTAKDIYKSSKSDDTNDIPIVLRLAARHALLNIREFGRPIPTFSQLRDSKRESTPDKRAYLTRGQ